MTVEVQDAFRKNLRVFTPKAPPPRDPRENPLDLDGRPVPPPPPRGPAGWEWPFDSIVRMYCFVGEGEKVLQTDILGIEGAPNAGMRIAGLALETFRAELDAVQRFLTIRPSGATRSRFSHSLLATEAEPRLEDVLARVRYQLKELDATDLPELTGSHEGALAVLRSLDPPHPGITDVIDDPMKRLLVGFEAASSQILISADKILDAVNVFTSDDVNSSRKRSDAVATLEREHEKLRSYLIGDRPEPDPITIKTEIATAALAFEKLSVAYPVAEARIHAVVSAIIKDFDAARSTDGNPFAAGVHTNPHAWVTQLVPGGVPFLRQLFPEDYVPGSRTKPLAPDEFRIGALLDFAQSRYRSIAEMRDLQQPFDFVIPRTGDDMSHGSRSRHHSTPEQLGKRAERFFGDFAPHAAKAFNELAKLRTSPRDTIDW